MARFTQFAVAAADEAIHDSGIALENIDHTRFGVILSSGIGGLPTIEEEHTRGQQRALRRSAPTLSPCPLAIWRRGRWPSALVCRVCAAAPPPPVQAAPMQFGDAFHRIRDGYEDRMLCGGSESCISPLGVGGFASMKALCTADDPARASIPLMPAQRFCDGRGQRCTAAGRTGGRQSARSPKFMPRLWAMALTATLTTLPPRHRAVQAVRPVCGWHG